jgi:hypothetical protein
VSLNYLASSSIAHEGSLASINFDIKGAMHDDDERRRRRRRTPVSGGGRSE